MASLIRKTRFAKFIWGFNTGMWTSFVIFDMTRGRAGSVAFDCLAAGLCLWAFLASTADDPKED